jgi:hypothetical protein
MPHFLLQTSPQGLIVQAAVMLSHARREALTEAGQQLPAPQYLAAMLDTGASISAIDPNALSALGLTPTGQCEIHTPSTQGVPVTTDTYDVCIAIIAGREGDTHFISNTIQVTASLLSGGIQALIGTDILKSCILTYNGADNCFTLAW